MWGIIPAAGTGSRIQPLAFSKELLPVGSRMEHGHERPRAVSEYLVERMILAGADKLCFVVSPGKTDILEYYGSRVWGAEIVYVVQQNPAGLCDALFRALPLISLEEDVLIGLPDTVWFPEDGFAQLADDRLSLLLFPVAHPEFFDAVISNTAGEVQEVQVKQKDAQSEWIWGGIRMPGDVFHALHTLWCLPGRNDEYLGTLINAWIQLGNSVNGVQAGEAYVDVGTLNGYRAALRLLEDHIEEAD